MRQCTNARARLGAVRCKNYCYNILSVMPLLSRVRVLSIIIRAGADKSILGLSSYLQIIEGSCYCFDILIQLKYFG
jgi:hypothetical protein